MMYFLLKNIFKINFSGNIEWQNTVLYGNSVSTYPWPIGLTDGSDGAIYIFDDDYVVWATRINSEGYLGAPTSVINSILPSELKLQNVFPNPFNPSTTISYKLQEQTDLSINIYDLAGRLVWNESEIAQPAGSYFIVWDGIDQQGSPAPSGVYLISLKTSDFREVQKAVLIR